MIPPHELRAVAVIGAGTMGPGMSAVFARHGFETRLADVQPEALERAKRTVDGVYRVLVGAELLTEEEAEAGRRRLTCTLEVPDALRGADLVLEAIPERLDLKQQFFADAERHVSEATILASNTSGIPITELGKAVQRPERVVGMHWSNPPHLIPVIEVIRGKMTSPATVEATRWVVRRLDMIPVLIERDVPGFVENRILYAIMREALHLWNEGVASAEDIDTIIRWGIGYKLAVIGPLALLDVAGLDIYHSVASYLNRDLSNATDVSPVVTQRVARGELGVKSGRGIFAYEPGEIPALMEQRMRRLLEVKKALSRAAT